MSLSDSWRRLLRRILPSRAYAWASDAASAWALIRAEGLRTYRAAARMDRDGSQPHHCFPSRRYGQPVFFRPQSQDLAILIQNLFRDEYGLLPRGLRPEFVIDAGSYIGDVSLYYLRRFPDCRVVALEPNDANHAIAELNLQAYGPRVTLLHKGLWSQSTWLKMEGERDFGKLVPSDDGRGVIECVSIDSIMATYGFPRLDVLKLDVEGAELEIVAQHPGKWLDRTRLIIVEFHGPDIQDRCSRVLAAAGFVGSQYRSVYYFAKAQT
jgi:FkbM family methyltransferase